MNYKMKTITILLVVILISGVFTKINIFESSALALDNFDDSVETPKLKPSFSHLNIDINDSLIISYEDINISDYECSINANGITASIVEDADYLQCEIEAIENVEFGILTVSAISYNGTELTNTIYTYNNGEKLFYSEFAKDDAWCKSTKDVVSDTTDWLTYAHWEQEYSDIMSTIFSGNLDVVSQNNSNTTISGVINWETDDTGTTLQLRNAYIEIIAKSDYEYFTLGSTYTNVNGEYNLQIPNNIFSQYSNIYLKVNLEAHTFKVRHGWHSFAYYFEEKLSDVVTAGDSVSYNPCIVYDESMLAYKATYVHQSMVIAERFAREMGLETSNKIRVAYPAGLESDRSTNGLSQMAFCWGEIFDNSYCAIGWNSYDNTQTVVHEYSHYVQASLENYGEPLWEILIEDPNHDGKSDYYAQKEDKSFAMHLTWTEGWGYAFAVMAQRYYVNEYAPLWGDKYITDILSYSDSEYIGEFQERSVKAFLWSLVDETTINSSSSGAGDYNLPWTPQEWWDMTTVSGTCRLPDFINLIENESYNLGVDIDYKQIKEFVAEKLTIYNIAPEIISITANRVNGSPIMRWKPNGSPTYKNGQYYSNNVFVVKIYDEDGNVLYTSNNLNSNLSNDDTFVHQIDQNIWNQITAGIPCYKSIYISIVGYREDDINDTYATSGPYYSKSFKYDLNELHEYCYELVDDEKHLYSCVTCSYNENLGHKIDVVHATSIEHYIKCVLCSYYDSNEHCFEVINLNDETHNLKCTVCEKTIDDEHSFSYTPFGSTHHYCKCNDCGYIDYKEHSLEYTTEDGIHYRNYCQVCGYSNGEELHTWVYTSINALYHEGHCADCGEIKTSREAHSWTVASDPKYIKCSFCGYLMLKPTGGGGIIPVLPTKKNDIEEETK